jgi:hypothetical protein
MTSVSYLNKYVLEELLIDVDSLNWVRLCCTTLNATAEAFTCRALKFMHCTDNIGNPKLQCIG